MHDHPEPTPTVENLQRRSQMFDHAYKRVRRAGAHQLADGHASAGVECKIAIDAILGPVWERV